VGNFHSALDSDREKEILDATQGPTAAGDLTATITTAAWRTLPCWYIVASNDRMISPQMESAAAAAMNAKTITLDSSHVPMLSHPESVADFIYSAAARTPLK
jgi:pimeloyl-ACP methyl ester carboxylesterase